MKIIYVPPRPPKPERGPRPPSWWRTLFKRTGTIVEHNGVQWVLVEWHLWGHSGRRWEQRVN